MQINIYPLDEQVGGHVAGMRLVDGATSIVVLLSQDDVDRIALEVSATQREVLG